MTESKQQSKKKKKRLTWRSWHKWVGVVFSIFILIFCMSGIVMNHRQFFSRFEVSRAFLPSGYQIDKWNQNVLKGTFPYPEKGEDALLAYGQSGVWLTDRNFKNWKDFNDGIDAGSDNRKIANIVRTSDGRIWCTGLYDAYRYDSKSLKWVKVLLPNNGERISDLTLRGQDTLVVATRSKLYIAVKPGYAFQEKMVPVPANYVNQVTLFKTFWELHSGGLFGTVGRLVVDFVALILIVLCITGIVFFVLSYSVKHTGKKLRSNPTEEEAVAVKASLKRQAGWMKGNLKWHNRAGAWMIVLTLLLSVTGMCLRPPLMIPLALTKVTPLPGSTLASKNVFHDKIRGIRWDGNQQQWLLSTSEGFLALDSRMEHSVKTEQVPIVSPMGITVFTPNPAAANEWLIGSFSGLFRWDPVTGEVSDWFTGEAPVQGGHGVTSAHSVTGWTQDLSCTGGKPVVFDYSTAPNVTLPETPEVLREQPMSLWNFALELHVGRCYEPFLGSVLSVLFVFLSGLLLTLVLLSGYIVYRRNK